MSDPAIGKWIIFARLVAKAARLPADPQPELARYATKMCEVTPPVMAMGDRALFNGMRWTAQAFGWSDQARREDMAPGLLVMAQLVEVALGPKAAEDPAAVTPMRPPPREPPPSLPFRADVDG